MKKKNIILIVVILILLIVVFIVVDLVRVVEKPRANVNYEVNSIVKAYSIEETGNKIILTSYNEYPPRQVTIFEFSNDLLIKITYERYYDSKMAAMFNFGSELESNSDAIRKGNLITYVAKDDEYLNAPKAKVLEDFEKIYSMHPKI